MAFEPNQAQFLIKYFCCAQCFSELMEFIVVGSGGKLSDVKCVHCECENLITKNTAEIKMQRELQRDKEIRTKIQMYKIYPLYEEPKDFNPKDTLKELGF